MNVIRNYIYSEDKLIVNRQLEHLHDKTLYAVNQADDYLSKSLPKKIQEIEASLCRVSAMKAELAVMFPKEDSTAENANSAGTITPTEKIDVVFRELLDDLDTKLSKQAQIFIKTGTNLNYSKNTLNKLEAKTKEFIGINNKSVLQKTVVNRYVTSSLDTLESLTLAMDKQKEIDDCILLNLADNVIRKCELFLKIKEYKKDPQALSNSNL